MNAMRMKPPDCLSEQGPGLAPLARCLGPCGVQLHGQAVPRELARRVAACSKEGRIQSQKMRRPLSLYHFV